MSRIIVDKQIVVIALGIFTAVGILSKCMVNGILSRLVRAAGNMNKSTHPLMRLVRAKFEHACMVSEKVEKCLWTSTCTDIKCLGYGFTA